MAALSTFSCGRSSSAVVEKRTHNSSGALFAWLEAESLARGKTEEESAQFDGRPKPMMKYVIGQRTMRPLPCGSLLLPRMTCSPERHPTPPSPSGGHRKRAVCPPCRSLPFSCANRSARAWYVTAPKEYSAVRIHTYERVADRKQFDVLATARRRSRIRMYPLQPHAMKPRSSAPSSYLVEPPTRAAAQCHPCPPEQQPHRQPTRL
jgi:hypothetical protein